MVSTDDVRTCYRHPDRETGLSCSECGRPICADCMTVAAVGLRCPEHSGAPQGVRRVTKGVRRASYEGTGARVTRALIAVNVLVYLAMLATGASLSRPAGPFYEEGALYGPFVAQGDWWRLLTAAFLHASLFHLGINMLILWMVGAPLETALGRGRYLLLYVVSGLAGSAGALLFSPDTPTVGASGAIFGIFGAAFVLERQGFHVLGGSATGLVVLNLVFTFAFARFGISIGGHLGGLVGGALAMLALTRFGKVHAAYGRPGLIGIGGVLAVGVASILISYLQVQQYV